MWNCLFAESQKYKRVWIKMLLWLAPLAAMSFNLLLMGGRDFQQSSYNVWYFLLLPALVSLLGAEVVQKDYKKLGYRAIFDLPIKPQIIWLGKIGVCTVWVLAACGLFFAGATLGGMLLGSEYPATLSLGASLLLFVTFLWQIPLCLFLSDRLGFFWASLLNLSGNVFFGICTAKTALWWIPYSIPARLMCATLGILPNGLSVPEQDPLWNTDVILPGIMVSLVLFAGLSVLTARWFNKREVG